jgi:hypothetical protein
VIAVEDYLARQSAGKLCRTPFPHDGNVPSAAFPSDPEPGPRRRSGDSAAQCVANRAGAWTLSRPILLLASRLVQGPADIPLVVMNIVSIAARDV